VPNVFKTACGCQKCPITTNECQNETAKERIVFLAIYIDLQGNMRVDINHQGIWIVPWRFLSTSKEITHFLRCHCKQPRKLLFPSMVFLTAKKNTYFLRCHSKPSSKLSFFLGGYWIFLGVGWNAYKYFGDSNWKNNNILKVSKNLKIWHEIIIWLYYLAIKFSNHITKVGLYIIHLWTKYSTILFKSFEWICLTVCGQGSFPWRFRLFPWRILGELLKWISQINMLQTLVSFESMKFVLCNGDVCLMVSR